MRTILILAVLIALLAIPTVVGYPNHVFLPGDPCVPNQAIIAVNIGDIPIIDTSLPGFSGVGQWLSDSHGQTIFGPGLSGFPGDPV